MKPDVPAGAGGVDYLVEGRLRDMGLKPSPEADRRTLIRRLYLDLIGLPPQPAEVDAFAADPAPEAYRRLVEKLLASPHFGERMAVGWLDVARFADTIGYHSDNPRNVWPYRDYAIRAFNENKPFDQFTIEQLAGDLLPNSPQEQKVGSCFNRLLLSTEEGGAQPKDYEARMLTDRVRAVGTVWLGQTLGCCQCHDHKFDPIIRDFHHGGVLRRHPGADPRPPGGRHAAARPVAGRRTRSLGRPDRQIRKAARHGHSRVGSRPEGVGSGGYAQESRSAQGNRRSAEIPPEKRSDRERLRLAQYYRGIAPQLAAVRTRLEAARKAKRSLEAAIPRCLVSVAASTPRTVRSCRAGIG